MTSIEATTEAALAVTGRPRWTQPSEPVESGGEIAVLLTISRSGTASVYSGKVEYGQGIRHSFALAVSDVLGVAPNEVEVVLADTAKVPWDRGTTGSASTCTVGVQLRRAALTARRALVELASKLFECANESVTLENGEAVCAGSGRRATFAALLKDEQLQLTIPDEIAADGIQQPRSTGTRSHRIDAFEKVTGAAIYSRDFSLPGLLYGRVIRPPSYGAKLADFNAARAERVPGFVKLVREGDFLGVIAESEQAADEAAETVRTRWEERRDDASDFSLPALLKETAGEPAILQESGSLNQTGDEGIEMIEATCYAPYVANAQMEPSAATAEWDGDSLSVWSGTRGPFAEREQLATALGTNPEQVRVQIQTVGGSFGTKTLTVSLEAAKLAKHVPNPVKVVYTRAEEFMWSTVRPAALIEMAAGVDEKGFLKSWDYHAYHAGENAFRGRRGAETPYDVPNVRVAVSGSNSPLQHGSYRSLGGAVNHFARETHMDRIARHLEVDPVQFRLQNLSHPRYVRVLREAARAFGWEQRTKSDDGAGIGVAVGFDAGSYVAECVEVEVVDGHVAVQRVTAAFDCGALVNEDGVRNQVEGSIVMGLGTALWETVEFDGGRVLVSGFNKYRVPRIMDTPEIDVVLVDDPSNPATGAGEPGIVPIAAAIANAVTDATGIAIEQLPVEQQLV